MSRYLQTILFFLSMTFFTQSVNAQDMPPDIARIIKRGTLRVTILKPDVPGFHYHDAQGQLDGYDIEVGKDMARHLGVKAVFYAQSTLLDDLGNDVVEGKADVIVSYSLFTKRAERVIYSRPQIIFNQALLVNNLIVSRNKWPLDPSQLLKKPGLTFATLAGSSFIDVIKSQYPTVRVVSYQNINEAFEDVKNGKIFGVFYVDKLLTRWLYEHPEANLYTRVLILPNKKMPIGMAVSWRDSHLMDWINTYITIIQSDGTLSYFKKKFFGSPYEDEIQ